MSNLARTLAVLTAGGAALLALPSNAWAQEAPAPERTAFYSAAGGAGLAAPQPVTNEGDLRISRTARTENFAALLYRAEGARAALDVTIRDVPPPAGTPDVVACPTVGIDWKAGPNQPLDAAPEYDCAGALSLGALSTDGTTLSFALDPVFQVQPGVWSFVLVPRPYALQVVVAVPEPPAPFSLDLVKPVAGSFVAEPEFVFPPFDASTTSSDSGTDMSTGTSGEALTPGSFEMPVEQPAAGGIAEPPLVAGGADVPLPAAEAAVPQPQAAGVPGAFLPVSPAGAVDDLSSGRRLLALLVLAGGSAAVGYAAGQQRPGPRLIGGRSRAAVATAVPAVAGPAPSEERPRGIGRFAKLREAAPRRLR